MRTRFRRATFHSVTLTPHGCTLDVAVGSPHDLYQLMASLSQALRWPVIQRGILVQSFTTSAGPELQEVVEPATRIRPKASASYPPFLAPASWKSAEKNHDPTKKFYRPRSGDNGTSSPRNFGPKPWAHPPHSVKQQQPRILLPTSPCVRLRDVPPLATLEDICSSVGIVLDIERQIGIRDLDAPDGRLLTPSAPWVKSAKALLSTHGRPTHWRLEFENRSIAHAFLEHAREAKFMCVWKEVSVVEWEDGDDVVKLDVNDSMIRVENCPSTMTVDLLRHVFRRYDFARSGSTIFRWEEPKAAALHNMFVIRFSDPSYARAAVREMQGLKIHDAELRLAQYPKQLVLKC